MPILSSPSRPVHSRVVFDSASRLPRRSFGAALMDHTPEGWGAVDASLVTDAELAPLAADDESMGGLIDTPAELSRLYQLAYSITVDGHSAAMPKGLGRFGIASWVKGECDGKSARWDRWYDLGLARGLEDRHPTGCPARDAEAAHGWECGQKEAGFTVHVRLEAEIAAMEERQRELDAICAGHPWL